VLRGDAISDARFLPMFFRPEYSGRADILVRLMIAGNGSAFIASGLGIYVITAAREFNSRRFPLLTGRQPGCSRPPLRMVDPQGNGLKAGPPTQSWLGAVLQLIGTGAISLEYIDRRLEPFWRIAGGLNQ